MVVADTPVICRDLDGALLVVRAGDTRRELVDAAIDALAGVPVHGIVLNAADQSALGRGVRASVPLLPPRG
jgi:Mrp family chromosome partitioning ATPase